MPVNIREIPSLCLAIALFCVIAGKLRLLQEFRGETLEVYDGSHFRISRNRSKAWSYRVSSSSIM